MCNSSEAAHIDRTLPFELLVLECALATTAKLLSLEVADFEQIAIPVLDDLAAKVCLFLTRVMIPSGRKKNNDLCRRSFPEPHEIYVASKKLYTSVSLFIGVLQEDSWAAAGEIRGQQSHRSCWQDTTGDHRWHCKDCTH